MEDYRSDQLIDDIRLLAKGFQVVPGSFWERVGECDSETHGRDTVHVIDSNLLEGCTSTSTCWTRRTSLQPGC